MGHGTPDTERGTPVTERGTPDTERGTPGAERGTEDTERGHRTAGMGRFQGPQAPLSLACRRHSTIVTTTAVTCGGARLTQAALFASISNQNR